MANPDAASPGTLLNRKRWGPPRRIHIGDLSPAQRELVITFIEAQRRANAKPAVKAA